MKTVNEVHLIGRAGKDATANYTKGGKLIVKFSLATGGGKKKGSDESWPTDWHNCTVFGEELGQVARTITKGQAVEVYGRISYGSYEKDGRKVNVTDIIATKLGDPETGDVFGADNLPTYQANRDSGNQFDDSDSIPF